MKLKEIKTNTIKERLENFKKKRVNEKLEGDLPLDNKITIEMPVLIATALKDMDKNKKKNEEDLKEINKASEDFVKETEKQFKEAEKKAKAFKESYLEENFKDKWLKENNSYSVKCKGRKELRALIQECKDTNIRYKFEKLTEGEDKYVVKFKLNEQVKLREDWMTNYERGLQAIQNGVNQCLYALAYRDGYHKDHFEDIEQAVEQSFNLSNIEDEINDFYNHFDFVDSSFEESLNEDEQSDNYAFLKKYDISKNSVEHTAEYLWTWLEKFEGPDFAEKQVIKDKKYNKDNAELLLNKFYSELKTKVNQMLEEGKGIKQQRINDYYTRHMKENLNESLAMDIDKKLNDCNSYEDVKDVISQYPDKLSIKRIEGKKAFEVIGPTLEQEEKGRIMVFDGQFYDDYAKENNLSESLELMGDINDYTPWGEAVTIYNQIVNADKLSSLDKLLNDIYQDGVSLKQLNDFLSNYPDFIRSMLDLDENGQDEDVNDLEVEMSNEEPVEEPQEPKSQYLNDETGYGDNDEDTGDDDTEGLEDFLDKVAEEE